MFAINQKVKDGEGNEFRVIEKNNFGYILRGADGQGEKQEFFENEKYYKIENN